MKTLSLIAILFIITPLKSHENDLIIGDQTPEIALPDIENRTIELSSLQGKVVLVTFWASWCKYCKNDLTQTLIPLYKKYNREGFEVYSISLDNNLQSWKNFSSKNEIGWTNVVDSDGFKSAIVKQYGIKSIPQNFLINQEGKLISKDLQAADLEIKLKELLN